MFDKLQQAFWKALTPDLVPDETEVAAEPVAGLSAEIVAALGGVDNLKSQQPVALTRVRVALHDEARVDPQALSGAGVAGVMSLGDGVLHLITGLRAEG
ncbi:PTS transporter subunit EIIB [Pseudomonas moraviensis subsp. stanleyae]|uniref:PTS transporter subunit EIIB n=1 Tax=Pseudomonas moraviensis TaxID=321662 RepID=UPI002E30A702|nr:PTS transporter subunit EIIB [Pseudomonas moraviensis]MED7667262.1 PTS transporter subunit EIIB [Pseudomonas moraviensis subsp. stanleyae]